MIQLVSYPIVGAFTSIAISLILLFCFASGHATAAEASEIRFEDADGHEVSLNNFKGKAIILNLWATWCAPCVQEMPSLAALQEKYKEQGLVVLALSEDSSASAVPAFYKSKSITALFSFFDKNHLVWRGVKARGVPTSLFIGRDGTITKTLEGPVKWLSPDIEKDVLQLIDKH